MPACYDSGFQALLQNAKHVSSLAVSFKQEISA
jgi:hypothetical protein